MKSFVNYIKPFLSAFFIMLFTVVALASGKDSLGFDNIEKYTIVFPRKYQPFEIKASISMLVTKTPMDWSETGDQQPLLKVMGRIGLPERFTLDNSIQLSLNSNLIRLGPKWNYNINKFSLALGFDAAYVHWRLNTENTSWAWAAYPNISFGYNMGNMAFTFAAEANIIYSLNIEVDNVVVSRKNNFLSGGNMGLYVEQKLWGKQVVVIGFIYNYQKVFNTGWSALEAFDKNYGIPQVNLGFVF